MRRWTASRGCAALLRFRFRFGPDLDEDDEEVDSVKRVRSPAQGLGMRNRGCAGGRACLSGES